MYFHVKPYTTYRVCLHNHADNLNMTYMRGAQKKTPIKDRPRAGLFFTRTSLFSIVHRDYAIGTLGQDVRVNAAIIVGCSTVCYSHTMSTLCSRAAVSVMCIVTYFVTFVGGTVCNQSEETGTLYCLNKTPGTWKTAQTLCNSQHGRLAVDTSDYVHSILTGLVKGTTSTWIGGKTTPLYWNWIGKDVKLLRMFYQGCYYSDMSRENCVKMEGLTNCKEHCQSYQYLSLHESNPDATNKSDFKIMCCCGNDVVGDVEHSSNCSYRPCFGQGLRCPKKPGYNAVYSIDASYDDIRWKENQPDRIRTDNNEALCAALEVTTKKMNVIARNCNEKHKPLCILNHKGSESCDQLPLPTTEMCLFYSNDTMTWMEAVDYYGGRTSQLFCSNKKDTFQNISANIYWIRGSKDPDYFWLYGSTTGWAWDTAEGATTIANSHWRETQDRLPLPLRFIFLNENEKWGSKNENESADAYICEFGNFSQTTLPMNLMQTATTGVSDFRSTSGKDSQTEGLGLEPTTDYGSLPSSPAVQSGAPNKELPIYAGVGAGVGLLVLALVVFFLLCRRKRTENSGLGQAPNNAEYDNVDTIPRNNNLLCEGGKSISYTQYNKAYKNMPHCYNGLVKDDTYNQIVNNNAVNTEDVEQEYATVDGTQTRSSVHEVDGAKPQSREYGGQSPEDVECLYAKPDKKQNQAATTSLYATVEGTKAVSPNHEKPEEEKAQDIEILYAKPDKKQSQTAITAVYAVPHKQKQKNQDTSGMTKVEPSGDEKGKGSTQYEQTVDGASMDIEQLYAKPQKKKTT